MEKIYYFGDLCYIFDDDTWQQIANQFLRQTDDNDKFVFKKDGKEIALYMNSTQNGDGGYELHHLDLYNVTHIIYRPSEIGVDSGTVGLVCLNHVCVNDDELIKLVNEIKDHDYGLLFTFIDGIELQKKLSEMKIPHTFMIPTLKVEEEKINDTANCPCCDGSGYFDSDNCCSVCDGRGYVDDERLVYSHEVKLEHHMLFRMYS